MDVYCLAILAAFTVEILTEPSHCLWLEFSFLCAEYKLLTISIKTKVPMDISNL